MFIINAYAELSRSRTLLDFPHMLTNWLIYTN